MTTESELTNALLESFDNGDRTDFVRVEEPYNHYGDRGVVDLYIEDGHSSQIYELKSEAALSHATGANEIIRQFNKSRKYFFQGSDHHPSKNVQFELCFTPSNRTFRHLANNQHIYRSAIESELYFNRRAKVSASVCVRPADPENIMPIIIQSANWDCREEIENGDWLDYVEFNQPKIYEECEEALKEMAEQFSDF